MATLRPMQALSRLPRRLRGLAAAAVLALGAPVWACGPYSVAFYEIGSLYYRQADGSFTGIDKDLVDEIARRSGCRFEYRTESRVRIWNQLEQGSLDMSVSAIPTPDRERYGWFLPYYRTRNFALLRHEQAERYPNAAAFLADPARRAVVVRGYKHGPSFDAWLDTLRAQGRVSEVPDFPAAVRVLHHGKADLLVSGPIAMARLMSQEAWLQDYRFADWAPQDSAIGALVGARARVSEADRQLMQRHLREMHRDGALAEILRRHAGARALDTNLIEIARP